VSFGGALVGVSICSLVIEQTDRLVIGAFRPIAEVTHYSAAWKLYMLAFALPTIVLQAVSPMAASFHGRKDHEGLKRLFLRMGKYSAAVALPLTVALGLTAGTLLRLWMGPAFVDARWVVAVLAVSFAVTSFNHAGYSILVGTRQIAPLLWFYWMPQALLNLVLSLWLVQPLGIVGVALGTAIPAILLEYPFLRFVLSRIGVGWRDFSAAVVLPTVLPVLVAFAPLALAYFVTGPVSVALPITAVACGMVFAGLFWRFALEPTERDDLVGLVQQRFRPALPAASSDVRGL
jgi:O-antigen/teichoic acid export membrane protein